jgi:hypothetical protein
MCDDTTFSNLDGAVSGNISRCTIAAYQPITIEADLYILDSKLTQKSPNTELVSVANGVYKVAFTNCTLDLAGMLLYSEEGSLIVIIYGGFINSQYALTNGYARVYLNAVFNPDGTLFADNSAYSKNGLLFDNIALASEEVISGDLTAWHNVNKSDLELDGSYLKAKEDIPMSNNLGSPYALRFRKATAATKMLFELGGKIQLDVEFPAGVDSEIQGKVKLRPVLYTPYTYLVAQNIPISDRSFMYATNTDKVSKIGNAFASCAKDSAKLRSIGYVWSGDLEPSVAALASPQYLFDGYMDIFGAAVATSIPGIDTAVGNYIPYIVIAAEENCVLPKGTKIKITIIPNITKKGFEDWFTNIIEHTDVVKTLAEIASSVYDTGTYYPMMSALDDSIKRVIESIVYADGLITLPNARP